MDKREKMLIPTGSDCRHHQEEMHSKRAHPKERPEEERNAVGFVFGFPLDAAMGEQPADAQCASMGSREVAMGRNYTTYRNLDRKVLFGTNAKREMNYSVCREVSFRGSVRREVF